MAVRIRRAAWSGSTPADGWSDDLKWYAAAIHQMKLLTPGLDEYRPLAMSTLQLLSLRNPTLAQRNQQQQALGRLQALIQQWSDPRSLGYQAQVHDTFIGPSTWPKFHGVRVLWRECAHGNWFFLPWHRAYLLEFEAVARAHIATLGGPADTWALPYWNSSDYRARPDAATLPRPLRAKTLPANLDIAGMPGGAAARPNPLHEPSRVGPGPSPSPPSNVDWPDASIALQRHHYANAVGFVGEEAVTFGGGYLEDLTVFHSSQEPGQVDAQPHGSGHTQTGGFMSTFLTAGLDPVFWMHHANVDRLWETYAHPLGHGYPFPKGRPAPGLARQAYDSWSGRAFRFLRPDGSVKEWKAPQVLDVEALGYRYDTVVAPTFNQIAPSPPAGDIDPFGLVPGEFAPLAAASDASLAGTTTVTLRGGDGADGAALVQPGQRWIVRLDGIRSRLPAVTSYAVHLELHRPDAPAVSQLLGPLTLFGVFEASLDTAGERGTTRVLEATGTVERMPRFDPFAVRLRFVPTASGRDVGAVGLTVERISLEAA